MNANQNVYMPFIGDNVRAMLSATNKWLACSKDSVYRIHVVTGDKTGAGTDANVYIILKDMHGTKSSIIKPKTLFSNDHERGTTTTVEVSASDLGISPPFVSMQVWRDNFGNIPSVLGKLTEYVFGGANKEGSAAWFLDRVEIEIVESNKSFRRNLNFFQKTNRKLSLEQFECSSRSSSENSLCDLPPNHVFPVQRWIESDKLYQVELYDTVLPQCDKRPITRTAELVKKKVDYQYTENLGDLPAQAASLPSDEKFSEEYYWTFAKEKAKLLAKTKFVQWTTRKWKSIEELKTVTKKSLGETECMPCWRTDEWFGIQRLQGVNPYLLSLCKEIPEKLDVTEDTVRDLIGPFSLDEALEKNRIFICDLEILDGIACKNDRKLAAPIALFYLNCDSDLLPIAIQLHQRKGPNNPVYTPNDAPNTWLVAKMYYNNAEAQHHQGVSHLGLTHLLMEGICLCTHRQLSPSHPIFKLMAPHFLFLIAINSRGLEKLISPGGWVDGCMTVGIEGIYEIIRRGIKNHNFYTYGNIEEEIKSRGVLDPEILPNYAYRDDSILLYNAIRKYVSKVVHHYYDSEDKLVNDWELKEWRLELSRPREKAGVGLAGVPGDDEKGFLNVEELIDTVTIIISTCSVAHAAANFQQYDQFGFVPNYSGILLKDPPTEKRAYTEAEILELLPDMETTLSTMVITKLLSSRGTNSLGDFEMQYLYHPTDVQAAEEFREDIRKISSEIKKKERKIPFKWLDPEFVPNSISI
ncbi:UNVERIFIED_CONTAM: hypothetical protein GTU68_035281 [Idotea baltica]|nr:hypothetical protein [Idotea baltica]